MRQSKAIVGIVAQSSFTTYCEPFCGAMWSAVAVAKRFPDKEFIFSDANPYLIRFWQAAILEGWNPPSSPTEADYNWYNKHRPTDDPMTGYLGFAWSFGGKFFGGLARRNGVFLTEGSYDSTMSKIAMLRTVDVKIMCDDYLALWIPDGAMVYLDPPYVGRTPQSFVVGAFDRGTFELWASLLAKRCRVISTEFTEVAGWRILHDYGDTVVRHFNAKPKDGTRELLMEVL